MENYDVFTNSHNDAPKQARLPEGRDKIEAVLQAYLQPHNEVIQYKQDMLAALYAKYPYFFHKKMSFAINIPVGWLRGIEQALDKFVATGMGILIRNIVFKDGYLQVQTSKRGTKEYHVKSEDVLNDFLKPVSDTCTLCGEKCTDVSENGGSIFQRKEKKLTCSQCEKDFSGNSIKHNK